jgi:hypothetical protein
MIAAYKPQDNTQTDAGVVKLMTAWNKKPRMTFAENIKLLRLGRVNKRARSLTDNDGGDNDYGDDNYILCFLT